MNKLRAKLERSEKAIGTFAHVPSPLITRLLANSGMDFVFIDQQHGIMDMGEVDNAITPLIGTDCTPIVRVSTNDPGLVMASLDRGAEAVVCPLVNTGEEAARFVDALRYPPEGGRSWGPIKPMFYHGEDYTQRANKEVMAIAQIETKTAVENMEDILSTKGLDAILIGPNDLGFTYGNQPQAVPTDPVVWDAIKEVGKACNDHGIYAGIHSGSTDMSRKVFDWGFDFVSMSADIGFIAEGAKNLLSEMKQ